MFIKSHRIKRLVLVAASTAALSGAFIPMAMADTPSGSGSGSDDIAGLCQTFHDSYNDNQQKAYDAYTAGNLWAGNLFMAEAGNDLVNAEKLGCDTTTWAGTTTGTVSPVVANRVSGGPVTVAQP